MIYLDSAATTLQKPPAVYRAVRSAMATMTSPGRGTYGPAARASRTLLACREAAAALFQVDQPEQVVLTFNATHGLNLAIHSLVRPGATVLLSGYEHNAVTRPLAAIPELRLRVVRAPMFCPDLFLEALEHQLNRGVDVVICTHVSNVFGYVLPVEEVANLCRQRQVPLIVDASQSAGVLPVTMQAWGAAFVAMPGHKSLYGPQGTGLLLCREGGEPLLRGVPAASRASRRCPTFCRTGWRRGPTTSPARRGCWRGSGFSGGGGLLPSGGRRPPWWPSWPGGWTGCRGCRCTPLGRRGARRGCSPSGWPTGTRGGWPTPSASGAWRCGRGFTAPRWPMPPAAQRPPAPCGSAFLPSTPAERWNVSSNTWQGWDRNEQKRPGFQGAFLSRRG